MRSIMMSLSLLAIGGSTFAGTATVWIGTTTPRGGESKGIYRATMDLDTGVLSKPVLAAEIGSPGFLTLHPNGTRLYSVCQLPDGQGGGVAVFKISEDGESLRLLNTQPIGDGGSCHLTVDKTGLCLFTAQYSGGSVAVFPLDGEGRILPRSQLVEHEGSGPDEVRQKAPHPHWAGVDPANRFLFVPDLGIDQVVIYRIDFETGQLERHGAGRCPPGAGPRHFKFHPNGKMAYVVNELDLSVTVFRYDADAGSLEPVQTISTLPEELREIRSSGSEIRVHPSGKYVYAANRGHDTIAAFRIDPASGKLTFIEREPIRGSWPRNFNLDPTGQWLLAAGRNSNTISVFRVDPDTGGLIYTGNTVNCPTPICVEFQSRP